jgi:hypothetical protein
MKCWSCGKTLPKAAKVCRYCEAPVHETPTEEEKQIVRELLGNMDPDVQQEFMAAMREAKSGEDFANLVMVGKCPQCGSAKTGDCENDPDLEDPFVGRCFACGHLWCLECGRKLGPKDAHCTCYEARYKAMTDELDKELGDKDEDGDEDDSDD